MKVVVLLEVPEKVGTEFIKENKAYVTVSPNTKISVLSVKPLPKKKVASNKKKIETSFEYVHGFNDCIREITGETE
jgi:hypothetical protein